MLDWTTASASQPNLAGARFRNPNEKWEFAAYRDRSDVVREFGTSVDAARESGALRRWKPGWVRFLAAHVGAWMHVEHGLGQHLLRLAAGAPAGGHAAAITANGLRRVAVGQDLAVHNLVLAAELAGFDVTDHRRTWHGSLVWAGVREFASLATAVEDWAEALFAVNVIFEPLVGELFRDHLVLPAAPRNGDLVTPLLLRAAGRDFAEKDLHATLAMFGPGRAGPAASGSATSVLAAWTATWAPRALAAAQALQPLWAAPGVPPARFTECLDLAMMRAAAVAAELDLDLPAGPAS